jgi:hypothetical protein
MLALGLIDFDHPVVCLDRERYRGNVAGFALVRFRHDEAVRFPALPVYGADDNLFFPRRGLSYCTAAEIEVAMNLGAVVEIVHGVIFPWLNEAVRPFAPFVRTIRDLRAQHPKGSFDNEYVKLAGNGLFGKFGQGLKEKKVFDTGKMRSVELEESEITNEVFFSFVTGFIRALIAELLNGVPRHYRIVSVTTDGFLCSCPLEEIDQGGPIATRFKALTALVSDKPILEVKHVVRQAISARIRAQFTAIPVPGEDIVLAKGNVTPEIELPDREIGKEEMRAMQNRFMLGLYLNRTPDSQTMMRSFISVRQQWTDDLDVFQVEYLPYAQQVKKSFSDDASKFRIYLEPKFGPLRLAAITPRDIQLHHAAMKAQHTPGTANRHLALLSAIFRKAVEWGRLERSPVAGIKAFKEDNVVQNFLSADQLAQLFAALDADPNQTAAAALKLLALTGVRREEALQAEWRHIDLERGQWWLAKTKAGKGR